MESVTFDGCVSEQLHQLTYSTYFNFNFVFKAERRPEKYQTSDELLLLKS